MAAHHAVPLASGHSAASMNSTLSGKGALLLHNSSSTLHALNGSNLTAAGFIDIEADEITPGYAVLLMYVMLFMTMGAQAGLVLWRKQHKRSYDLVSLAGLWLMPAIISLQLKFWRFLVVWAAYSLITGHLMALCTAKKMHHSTPRKVYGWFLATYKVSVAVGMTGYLLLLLDMFGVGLLLARILEPGLSLLLLWYGLFFGILGRDLAEVASEQMANTLGSGKRLASTVNSCGMCGGELKDNSHLGEEVTGEPVRQLACKHCFHELCIRGWTIVGKKDVCPVCLEKVDMRDLCADKPWETQNLSWIQMLDTIRYMIVWFPLIFLVISVIARMMPHHHVSRHIAVAAFGPGANATALKAAAAAGAHHHQQLHDAVDVGAIAAGAR